MKNIQYPFCKLLKPFKRYAFVFIVLSVAGHAVNAQTALNTQSNKNGSVSGRIFDEHQKPAEFITIGLFNQKDSSLVKSTLSDYTGSYVFTAIPTGAYLIKASAMGYKNIFSKRFVLDETHPVFTVDNLKLTAEGISLSGVTVTSRKPLIEQKIDRTVMNVENSIIASGNNVLDVLEKAPGVSIDRQNDLIRLKNKSGVLVMIDGKRNYLSDSDLNNYLRNMRSEQVSSIEIITNPSSKYDAAGNSGIINIKLKKNTAFGTNGSVSVNGGKAFASGGPKDLYNGSLNLSLNHRIEKWNIYGTASSFRDADFSLLSLFRKVNYEGLNSTFNQNFYKPRTSSGISGKAGVDYLASEKTTIGLMVDAGKWNGKLNSDSHTNIMEEKAGVLGSSSLIQKSEAKMPRNNITTNFNVKHEFDKKGMELVFDADYSRFRNQRDQSFDTDFFNETGGLTNNLLQQNNTLSKIDIYAAKLDLTLPLSNKLKLETGLKSGYVNTDNDFKYEEVNTAIVQHDPSKSNRFIYKEKINAAYVNLAKEWNKWSIQAGLRAEYTQSNGNLVTDNKVSEKDYLSLFPTLFLSQTINKDNSIRYSYGRRIDRPNYQQLNPFVFFLDPYTQEEGNPYLKPQFTDNFEISYTYKSAVSFSLGYSNTKDYMLTVTEQDDATGIVRVGQGNIGNYKNYSANLSFPLQLSKWWRMQNQAGTYYNKFSDPNVAGVQFEAGRLAYNFNTSNSLSLSKTWTFELNFWFNSPSVYGVDRATRSQYALNAGIQKSFMDNKAKLKLNVNDILYSSYYEGALKYANVDFTVFNKWASRRANLSFTYNFGNRNIKSSGERRTATEDLKNRAGAKN